MFTRSSIAVIVNSALLLAYCLLLGSHPAISTIIFLLSPFTLIWMTIVVLKDKTGKTTELREGEEWGYGDISKDELGVL